MTWSADIQARAQAARIANGARRRAARIAILEEIIEEKRREIEELSAAQGWRGSPAHQARERMLQNLVRIKERLE